MGLLHLLRRWFVAREQTADQRIATQGEMLRDSVVAMARRLNEHNIKHALIGGVALTAHGIVRATRDVDFLIKATDAAATHTLMQSLGFEPLFCSDNVANYQLDTLRVDFLFARRDYSMAMLQAAQPLVLRGVPTAVVAVEDLIGLKLQGYVNDPTRTQDRVDIEQLLRDPTHLDMARVRDYFAVMDREALLLEVLGVVKEDG